MIFFILFLSLPFFFFNNSDSNRWKIANEMDRYEESLREKSRTRSSFAIWFYLCINLIFSHLMITFAKLLLFFRSTLPTAFCFISQWNSNPIKICVRFPLRTIKEVISWVQIVTPSTFILLHYIYMFNNRIEIFLNLGQGYRSFLIPFNEQLV